MSDSHGNAANLDEAIGRNRDADLVLHLGDGTADFHRVETYGIPVYKVKGNGEEWFVYPPESLEREMILTLDGVKILMMHGHTPHDVKFGYERAAAYAAEKDADILLFGHTHTPLEKRFSEGDVLCGKELKKPLYVFNPGSLGRPHYSAPASFGIITIRDGKLLLSHGEI